MSSQPVIVYKDKYWSFIPKLIPTEYFDTLYNKLYEKTGRYPIKMRGNTFTSRRRSCTYINNKDGMLGYVLRRNATIHVYFIDITLVTKKYFLSVILIVLKSTFPSFHPP